MKEDYGEGDDWPLPIKSKCWARTKRCTQWRIPELIHSFALYIFSCVYLASRIMSYIRFIKIWDGLWDQINRNEIKMAWVLFWKPFGFSLIEVLSLSHPSQPFAHFKETFFAILFSHFFLLFQRSLWAISWCGSDKPLRPFFDSMEQSMEGHKTLLWILQQMNRDDNWNRVAFNVISMLLKKRTKGFFFLIYYNGLWAREANLRKFSIGVLRKKRRKKTTVVILEKGETGKAIWFITISLVGEWLKECGRSFAAIYSRDESWAVQFQNGMNHF